MKKGKFFQWALIISILFFEISGLFAQNVAFDKANFKGDKVGFTKANMEFKAGNNFYLREEYAIALEHFLLANEYNPDNAELNMKIGGCYLGPKSVEKSEAFAYLEKAIKLDPKIDNYVYYLLGRAYHLNLEWDKAIKTYGKYKPPAGSPEVNELKKRLEECKTGKELMRNPAKVKIENLGKNINTEFAEYCPIISADESVMMFTARRDNTTGGEKDANDNDYFEDVFISTRTDTTWSEAENMGPPVNTGRHDATVNLSNDGQKLFIYRDDENGNGNIFESVQSGDTWSEPKKLGPNINTKHKETSACFSNNGKTLYFVSDKPDGIGGRDIYQSQLDDKGEWGKAENLGIIVNTPLDEDAIFMHPDGKTLYFSSKGQKSMGGYDIFKTVLKKGKWSKPQNLGYPTNTPDDDVSFVLSANGRHGYYSTIKKEGFGKRDIYRITYVEDSVAKASEPSLTLLKGVTIDEKTKQPVEASIEIVDNTENKVIGKMKSNSATGKFIISLPSGKNYGIAVKAESYLFHSENFDVLATAGYKEIEKIIELRKIEVGSKIVLNNIFFDVALATLRPESTSELERLLTLLKEMPTLKIEISGHTDNVGSSEYNQKLSQSRAKAVVDYLIAKGVEKGRLVFAGYGFTQPIASNDTEEGKQLNRRTEFKILSK